jgi:hypothetical protein
MYRIVGGKYFTKDDRKGSRVENAVMECPHDGVFHARAVQQRKPPGRAVCQLETLVAVVRQNLLQLCIEII